MNSDDRHKLLLAGVGLAFGLYMARVLRVPAPRHLIEQVAVAAAHIASGGATQSTTPPPSVPKSFRVVKAKKLTRATVARPPLATPRSALTTLAFTREELRERAKEMMN